MNAFNAAWTLALKDLRSLVRDRTAMVLAVLVPIALVTVFGWIMAYAFGGSGGMPKVTLHVADLSRSEEGTQFIDGLKGADMIRVRNVNTKTEANPEQFRSGLRKLISDGDAHHILLIPQDYPERIASGATPNFEMFRDPGRSMEDRLIRISIMQSAMAELGGTIWIDGMERMLADQGMQPEGLENIRGWMTNIGEQISDFADSQTDGPNNEIANADSETQGARRANEADPADTTASQPESEALSGQADFFSAMGDIVPLETTDVAPPDRGKQVTYQQAQSVAGMTVMMLLFALTSCGSVLLTEREEGTLKRLFVQPIPRGAVLLGKFLFVFMVGICQMAILFVYGEWMFGVGLFRDPVSLFVLSVTWVITGGAFGMFLASVSRSSKQAESLASLLILVMAALGGCWFPLQMMNLPALLDAICKSTMTYWAMTGFQGLLWSQLPWYASKTLAAMTWQILWAIALAGLAVFFFRRNFCRG
ncbi:MAG: ABC transporter permease [Planctomycetota bacterium]